MLPKVLSIDEFRGNTEYGKFQCILTDPVHKKIVDVLPTRYHAQIYDYLRALSYLSDLQFRQRCGFYRVEAFVDYSYFCMKLFND